MDSPDFERAFLDSMNRQEKAIGSMETKVAVMATKMDSIIEMMSDFQYDLDGNGRPGLKDRLTAVETKVEERTPRTAQVGGIVVGSGAVTVLVNFLMAWLGQKHT